MTVNVFYVVNRKKETNEIIIDADEIIKLFKNAIKTVEKKLKRSFPCEFEFVQAKDAKENDLRFGYLWISSDEVFNMCKGLNPNGTERKKVVKKKYDPKLLQKKLEEFYRTPIKPNESWADVADQEEELLRKYSGVEITYLEKLIDLDKWMSMYEKFVITPLKMRVNGRTLMCTRTPNYVTSAMIKSHFSKFTKRFSVIILDNGVTKVVFDDVDECAACSVLRKKIKVIDADGKASYLMFRDV